MTAAMRAAPQLVDAELGHVPLRRFGFVGEIAPTVPFCAREAVTPPAPSRGRRRFGLRLRPKLNQGLRNMAFTVRPEDSTTRHVVPTRRRDGPARRAGRLPWITR